MHFGGKEKRRWYTHLHPDYHDHPDFFMTTWRIFKRHWCHGCVIRSVQFQLGGLTWGERRPATSSRSSHRPYIVMTSQIFKSPFSTRETFHKYQTSRDQKFIIERVISDLLVVRGVLSTVYRFLFGQTAFWAAGDISAAIPWVSKIRNKAEQHSWGPDCYWLHMI